MVTFFASSNVIWVAHEEIRRGIKTITTRTETAREVISFALLLDMRIYFAAEPGGLSLKIVLKTKASKKVLRPPRRLQSIALFGTLFPWPTP